MKKKQVKSKTPQKRISQYDTNLGDLGLEPPKIYREAQKKIATQPQKKQTKSTQKQPLSRNEKREKQAKKRKKRNKLRKIILWFFIIVLIVAVGVVLSLTVFFNIENVTVKGNERYSTEEILAQCTIDKGENLFLADTDDASEMLEKNLPYIYTAQISRKLPSTIEIKVTEVEPSYYIQNEDDTYILLDSNFKVLETSAEQGTGIAILNASVTSAYLGNSIEFEDEDISNCLQKLVQAVSNNNISEITAIYSNNLSDNYVVYDNRIEFKLGTCDDLETKIYQGLASCEQLNESSPNAEGTMTINGGKQIYFTEK